MGGQTAPPGAWRHTPPAVAVTALLMVPVMLLGTYITAGNKAGMASAFFLQSCFLGHTLSLCCCCCCLCCFFLQSIILGEGWILYHCCLSSFVLHSFIFVIVLCTPFFPVLSWERVGYFPSKFVMFHLFWFSVEYILLMREKFFFFPSILEQMFISRQSRYVVLHDIISREFTV